MTTKPQNKKPNNKYVWTCDYCGKQFNTLKKCDEHELRCDKNQDKSDFPYIRNPKKSWLILWVTTMLVFGIMVYINMGLSPKGLSLWNEKGVLYLFLGNIVLGIIAFFGTMLSLNRDERKVSSFIKYSLLFCLLYFFINVGVALSTGETQKKQKIKKDIQENSIKTELQNMKYDGKVISGSILNKSNKPIYNNKIILKISKNRENWIVDETHEFVVPYKIDPNQSIIFSENYKTTKKDPWWTGYILDSRFYNGEIIPTQPKTEELVNCPISKECGGGTKLLIKSVCGNSTCCGFTGGRWIFYESKSACIRDQNKGLGVQSNPTKINCIGPDGKNFQTTQTECDNFNKAWGKKAVNTQAPINNNQIVYRYPACAIYYPSLKTTDTYYHLSPEECTNLKNKVASGYVVTPIPTMRPTSVQVIPTLISATQAPVVDQAKCNEAVRMWSEYKADFYANRYPNYSSSFEAIAALEAERQYIQSIIYSYGCTNTISL